jgi:SAM-dependent methyltransferase
MIDPASQAPRHEGWDLYWSAAAGGSHRAYSAIAGIYRRAVIRPRLEFWIRRSFREGSELLHAGCGSGEVDANLGHRYRITALDISPKALELYGKNNPRAAARIHGDLLSAHLPAQSFDGVYHLGLVEHFFPDQIVEILARLHAAVRPGGRLLMFWPLRSAPSVKVLAAWHRILNPGGNEDIRLHPPEPTLLASREQAAGLLRRAGWELARYSVSPWDFFIQAALLCERIENRQAKP